MKKLTILLLSFVFYTSFSQITITQNTDTTTVLSGGVTCPNEDNTTSLTQLSRSFDLASFGITSNFTVTNVGFGVIYITGNLPFTVKLSTTDAPYPNGNLTELVSEDVIITPDEHGTIINHTFSTPVVVPANSELVFSYEADGTNSGVRWFPATNNLGQSAPSYTKASKCGADNPITYESIGFPNVHLIMTITGESEEMGTFEVNSKALTVYPNPATDVINITLKNSVAQSVEIVNVAGQTVSSSSAKTGINTQNISSLTAGVYILRVKDNKGVTHVSKFVKK